MDQIRFNHNFIKNTFNTCGLKKNVINGYDKFICITCHKNLMTLMEVCCNKTQTEIYTCKVLTYSGLSREQVKYIELRK